MCELYLSAPQYQIDQFLNRRNIFCLPVSKISRNLTKFGVYNSKKFIKISLDIFLGRNRIKFQSDAHALSCVCRDRK